MIKAGDWVRVVKPYSGWLKVGDTYLVENVTSGITIRIGNSSVYFTKDYFELIEEPKPVKFEIGKKYTKDNVAPQTLLAVTSKGRRVWENSAGGVWTEQYEQDGWTEYKEPVTTYRWVCWYKENGAMQSNTQVVPRKVGERWFGMEILQVDVVKYTEE